MRYAGGAGARLPPSKRWRTCRWTVGRLVAPFAAALLELVQAQADDTSRFVGLPTWMQILDRHFPRPQ
ncbi:hypothetical protein ACIG0C_30820 [Kitasatospora aureofaciens]|uniref:hypothetical protein n=1 Tax=Kitasatospora aureofaciens TaxID=1894 RepID=UPI00092C320A|nr:hypothetical protein BOQ63_002425 [Streptomyces viridifaciens]